MLRAIEEALAHEHVATILDTHYKEALRRLADWEARQTEKRFFRDFESALQQRHPGHTLNKLKQELEQSRETSLQIFKAIHKEITDTDFSFSKDNLQDILKDILTNEQFKQAYKGIVIVYDEFGYALDGSLVNLSQLHEFAQFCANSGLQHLPVIFIGTGHKPFSTHGQAGDAIHYSTLNDRVNEIALQTEGMEDLIAAIVQQNTAALLWQQEVEPHSMIFSQLPVECHRLRLFHWLPAPKVKNNIIRNIYPMHPLATYALLRLASELGSDNRSVFKFFSPEFEADDATWKTVQDHSYPWFIARHDIVSDGQLTLYTADLLFEYFKESFSAGNRKLLERIRVSIANYEATIRQLNSYIRTEREAKLFFEADETMHRILKAMLVNEMISNDETPIFNTDENIYFALNAVTPSEKQQILHRLDILCQAGVLYKNDNLVYEFRRSDAKDVRRMITEFAQNPANRPTNPIERFLTFVPLTADEQFLEAKDYNTTYNEDKRLQVRFVPPAALEQTYREAGSEVSYFEQLEIEHQQAGFGKDGYEGTAVYLFCETDEAIEQAKQAAARNTRERVVLGVPKKPLPVSDVLLALMAVEAIQRSEEAESFGPQDQAQLIEIQKAAKETLNTIKAHYFDNTRVQWFGTHGRSLPVNESKRHDAANRMMETLFEKKRNRFSHKEYNYIHSKNSGTTRRIMIEAGDLLLQLTQHVPIDWSHPENRGDRKYLRRCFVDNQVLKLLHSEGDIRYYEVEREIEKFRQVLPAYTQLLEDLRGITGKGTTRCQTFFRKYFEEYGQGEIAVTLMLLLARRFYRDSLRFKRHEQALTDLSFQTTEDVIDLVTGKEPTTVLKVEEVGDEERNYFNHVYHIFRTDAEAGKQYGIYDAYHAITSWWNSLPIIAKSEPFYDDPWRSYVSTLHSATTQDPFIFMKHRLLLLFEMSVDEKLTEEKLAAITQKLETFKTMASGISYTQEARLLARIAEVFQSSGTLDVDLQDAIRTWHEHLDSYQKDQYSPFHNNESKILITRIQQLSNFRGLVFSTLPEAYGFGSVSNWGQDHTDEYIKKLQDGKVHIEQHKSPVGDVQIAFENALNKEQGQVRYKGKLGIRPTPEKSEDVLYYTDDGSDPSQPNSQKKRLQPGEVLTIKGGNHTLKIVACDPQGHFGKVQDLKIIDDSQKHAIKPIQRGLLETSVTFVFPRDKDGARVSIQTLFQELTESKVVSGKELEELVLEVLEQL